MNEDKQSYEEILLENKRLKEQIKKNETSINMEKALLEVIPDTLFIVSKEGKFLKFIPAKDFQSYIPPEVFLGKNIKDVFEPELSEKIFHCFNNLFETKQTQLIEYELIKNNKKEYYEARFVLSNENNVISIVRNISEKKYKEDKLKESEEKYKILIENTHEAVLIAKDGIIKFTNKRMSEMLSYNKEEMQGHFITDFIHKDDQELVLNRHKNRLKGIAEPLFYDFRVITKEGNIVWVQVNSVTFNLDNEPHALIYLNDITEKRANELKIKIAYEQLSNTLDTMSDGFVSLDENWLYTNVNKKAEEILGKTAEKLLGKNIWEVFPEGIGREFYYNYHKVMNEKTPIKMEEHYEPFDMWLENRINPLKNGISIFFQNITQRKKAELELKTTMNKYYNLFYNSPNAIFIYGNNNKIILVNKACLNLFGAKEEEDLLGKSPLELFIPEHSTAIKKRISKLQKSEIVIEGHEETLVRLDGKKVDVEIIASSFMENENINIHVSLTDITSRKEFQNKLVESEEKYRFLIENILDVVWVLEVESMKFIFVSSSIRKLRGYTSEEVMQQKLEEMLTPSSFKSAYTKLNERLDLFLETGKREVYTDEFEQICKDGSTIWCEIITYFRINPKNNKLEIIGTTRDINHRKISENTKLIEHKYRSLIENAPDAIILVSATGELKYSSPAIRSFGYTEDEFINLEANILTHPEELMLVIETINKVINDASKVITIQYRFKHKNNNWVWIESTFSNKLTEPNIEAIVINSRNIHDRKLIEEKLKESEEKYRTLIEHASDGIFLANEQGHYIEVNTSGCKLLGYNKEELLSKNIKDLIPPEELQVHPIKFKLLADGKTVLSERELLCKDGTLLPVEISAKKLPNSNLLGIVRDITDRKENEEKFSKIFNSSPDMLILTEFSTSKLIDVNEKFLTLTKHKKEEVIGKTTLEIKLWADSNLRSEYVNLLNTVGFIRDREYDFLLKSGELRNGSLSADIITINKVKYVLGTIKDITEQNKIQKELIYSENLLKEAQRISKIGNLHFEIAQNKLFWSDEIYRIFEVEKETFSATYEAFLNFVHPDDRVFVDEQYNISIKNKTPYDIIHRILMIDGRVKYLHEKGYTEYNKEGEPLRSFGTVQDITERVKIEEEIRHLNQSLEEKVKERTEQLVVSNKELESFAYSVSHDLRAPLRHIDGFTRILKNNIKENSEDIEKYFEKITESASKMSRMIDDLLKFSRLGRKVLEKTEVDLNLLVKQIIEQYKIDTMDRKIEFKVGKLPIVQGDQGLLLIAFENLISNAIKFTSKKELAIIEIAQCENCNKSCNIYIKDNGVGFDMAYADKLFGVFQRLHSENEFAGTGIGLANIKQIIQKHGGTIYAEGEVNKGATFFLSLK